MLILAEGNTNLLADLDRESVVLILAKPEGKVLGARTINRLELLGTLLSGVESDYPMVLRIKPLIRHDDDMDSGTCDFEFAFFPQSFGGKMTIEVRRKEIERLIQFLEIKQGSAD